MPLNISGSIVTPEVVREYEYNSVINLYSPDLYLDARIFSVNNGSTWYDISGNGYHATLQNTPTYSSTNNHFFTFDPTDDYMTTSFVLQAPSNSNLQTYNFWMFGTGSFGGSYADGTGDFHFGGAYNSTTLSYYVSYYGGASGETTDTATISPNTHNFITIVKTSAKKYDVYFNASKVINQANKEATVNTLFYPGAYYFAGWIGGDGFSNLPGNINSYIFFNKALTSSQISDLYNLTKYRYGL